MLQIVEINSKEEYNAKRLAENHKYDYLYICKHNKKIIMSDNGNEIDFSGQISFGSISDIQAIFDSNNSGDQDNTS